MRQSADGANSTNLTQNTALSVSGSISQRYFAGHKISKVRFLSDQAEFTGRLISGSWDSSAPQQGYLTLWQATAVAGTDSTTSVNENFERCTRLPVGIGNDVNDIFVINAQQFVASMSNGDVKIVDCPLDGTGDEKSKMSVMATYQRVHKHSQSASTAICVMDNEIYSGSDSGQIVRIQPSSRSSHAVRSFAEDLMGVTNLSSCGQFLMVSAHSTGQLHLWDVRKRALSPEFGMEPLNSRPVTALNNSITALAVHPAQHNVIGFGTHDGVVSFVDIRQSKQPLPIAFKVAQEPINELKFHPVFANNCFSVTDSTLIHWDGSVLARELNPISSSFNGIGRDSNSEAELLAAMQENENGNGQQSLWLSPRASTSMQLRVLLEEEPRLLSSFDVVQGALVAGTHTAELVLLTGLNFIN